MLRGRPPKSRPYRDAMPAFLAMAKALSRPVVPRPVRRRKVA
jgi:hypothetical protein